MQAVVINYADGKIQRVGINFYFFALQEFGQLFIGFRQSRLKDVGNAVLT